MVNVLGVAASLILSGIVVSHMKQDLVHLREVGAALPVNFINDDRQ